MFEVMPESGGRVLAVRLLQAYSKKDVLAFEKLLEEWIDRVGGQLDMLVKLDGLNLRRVPVENYIEDCRRTWPTARACGASRWWATAISPAAW